MCDVMQGDLSGALTAYRDSHDLVARLAASDPGNAGRQRDLAISHGKIGDVRVMQGDLSGALSAYRDSLDIAARLAASRSRQCRLAARPVGQPREDRRCAA